MYVRRCKLIPPLSLHPPPTLQAEWAVATAENAGNAGADGVVVAVGSEIDTSSAPAIVGVTAAITALRTALPKGALLAMMVPLPSKSATTTAFTSSDGADAGNGVAGGAGGGAGSTATRRMVPFQLDVRALASICDYLVAAAYDQCYGVTDASANVAIAAIPSAVSAFKAAGVPANRLVVTLAWYGWHFKCRTSTSTAAVAAAAAAHNGNEEEDEEDEEEVGSNSSCDTRPPSASASATAESKLTCTLLRCPNLDAAS